MGTFFMQHFSINNFIIYTKCKYFCYFVLNYILYYNGYVHRHLRINFTNKNSIMVWHKPDLKFLRDFNFVPVWKSGMKKQISHLKRKHFHTAFKKLTSFSEKVIYDKNVRLILWWTIIKKYNFIGLFQNLCLQNGIKNNFVPVTSFFFHFYCFSKT